MQTKHFSKIIVLEGVGSILQGEELSSFESLAKKFGLPYGVEGSKLRIK